MDGIILVALIFVVLSLANKYLRVPRDNNQRYDGINNRFYGEGYTGDTPVPPAEDNESENGQHEQQEEYPEERQEEQPEEQQGQQWEEEPEGQPVDQPDGQPEEQPEEQQDSAANTPAGDPELYGNIGDMQGVVIDTEVRIDPPAPQDSGNHDQY